MSCWFHCAYELAAPFSCSESKDTIFKIPPRRGQHHVKARAIQHATSSCLLLLADGGASRQLFTWNCEHSVIPWFVNLRPMPESMIALDLMHGQRHLEQKFSTSAFWIQNYLDGQACRKGWREGSVWLCVGGVRNPREGAKSPWTQFHWGRLHCPITENVQRVTIFVLSTLIGPRSGFTVQLIAVFWPSFSSLTGKYRHHSLQNQQQWRGRICSNGMKCWC